MVAGVVNRLEAVVEIAEAVEHAGNSLVVVEIVAAEIVAAETVAVEIGVVETVADKMVADEMIAVDLVGRCPYCQIAQLLAVVQVEPAPAVDLVAVVQADPAAAFHVH